MMMFVKISSHTMMKVVVRMICKPLTLLLFVSHSMLPEHLSYPKLVHKSILDHVSIMILSFFQFSILSSFSFFFLSFSLFHSFLFSISFPLIFDQFFPPFDFSIFSQYFFYFFSIFFPFFLSNFYLSTFFHFYSIFFSPKFFSIQNSFPSFSWIINLNALFFLSFFSSLTYFLPSLFLSLSLSIPAIFFSPFSLSLITLFFVILSLHFFSQTLLDCILQKMWVN